jgi:hypothetical protein
MRLRLLARCHHDFPNNRPSYLILWSRVPIPILLRPIVVVGGIVEVGGVRVRIEHVVFIDGGVIGGVIDGGIDRIAGPGDDEKGPTWHCGLATRRARTDPRSSKFAGRTRTVSESSVFAMALSAGTSAVITADTVDDHKRFYIQQLCGGDSDIGHGVSRPQRAPSSTVRS